MMSLPHAERKYITEQFVIEFKGNPNFKLTDPVPVLRFLYELCAAMVRGELPYQKCRAALDSVEFVRRVSRKELGSNLADVVTQMAQDLTMSGEYRGRLMKLAKWLVENALVPLRLFQERCEEEFLWEAEMIKIKAHDLKSKEVRVNTRLLYQQTKFNLLREETEGYAKLVTLLCQGSDSTQNASAATVGVIKSLIGQFDLDPNRVFDIVLDCFELQPDNYAFLKLIPIFPKSHASQILGFKFQYYQRMEVNTPVPFGLYKLTALLIKEEFIDLDSIYTHLLPKDDEAFEHYGAFSAKRLDEASKIGKINLAATGKDLMEDDKQGDVTVDLYAALEMENEAVVERAPELESNQKLGLLTGFLVIGDWYHAHILLDRLSLLNPVEHINICNMLFRLIGESISSAYEIVREKHLQSFGHLAAAGDCMVTVGSPGNIRFVDLPKELFQMLSSAGPYLYRDTLLLQKVCKVLKGHYLAALEFAGSGDGLKVEPQNGGNLDPQFRLKVAKSRVEEALGTCLLPSLQLIPANPAIGQAIWELMSLLPYEARYRLYGEWEKDDERLPMVLSARQTAKLDTRRILKRLAKENLKQLGRMVAKLAHANPMTVLRTIVNQIEAYRDMIAPVVDAFKYLTQLEYDILEYVVIERLARSGREKLKDDGLNLSDWLQSLASFWGHLCKKYPSMELRGLFQYLVNQLKKGEGIELVLLQELVQQMANVQYTENLTEEQLDAMAGGETLRYQATAFGATRNNKALIKSTNRLRDSLLSKDEPKLAVPLLLLIAQYRSVVVINADAPYIKMVSEQFDRCHGTLLQYVEFLSNAVAPTTSYAQLTPSLDDLVHQYHVDPEVAFLIYRPVMRLFKSQGSNTCWPLEADGIANTIAADSETESTEFPCKLVLDLGSSRLPTTWSDLLGTVKTMLPSKAWNSLSPDLYATFWGLTLYDLYVPRNRYESEISKLHAALKALEELPDNSSSAITKRKKEKERIQESLDRLTDELQRHEKNVASVRRRLLCEKDRWLSSCPDTLKINMEFLQRCIFPRCTFSMPDAVYCAMFVYTLHSLGTPFFNTVNHIDVLICKTLQPMICCCTEYEAGRLGRFLYETLKIAYHWKSDESVYERECGNMPGFAVYYRYPNSQRVTYGQFIKVHWKWSQRITKLLIHCLESAEYMEIRNALVVLTKISGVFPVTRKTGINLEKRVAKIKSDEREGLKVLATGVAAALASRKSSWVSDEEFGLGHLDLKPVSSLSSKSLSSNVTGQQHSSAVVYNSESVSEKVISAGTQCAESGNTGKDQVLKTKVVDGKPERAENSSHSKSDSANAKSKDVHASVTSTAVQAGASKSIENKKYMEESAHKRMDENMGRASQRDSAEAESGATVKQSMNAGSLGKTLKHDISKVDSKSGKYVGRSAGSSASERDGRSNSLEGDKVVSVNVSAGTTNGSTTQVSSKGSAPSSRHESSAVATKSSDKLPKRSVTAEESERSTKRRKGDTEGRDKGDVEGRDIDGDTRYLERERSIDPRFMDLDRPGSDERISHRVIDKTSDRSKDRSNEKYERDLRDRLDHSDKSRGVDNVVERSRDKSLERYGRERSVEKLQERGSDRLLDKAKDERKRQNESSSDKSHVDDSFHGKNLPPPPPLPPHVVPHSLSTGKRDEDSDRRFGSSRHSQRLSPRHDERRRSEESHVIPQDDVKRRREDEFRERKRDEREASIKIEESDRDRDRVGISKDEMDAAAKRRKLKKEHLPLGEPGEYSPGPPPPTSGHLIAMSQSSYDGRDRGDRKGAMVQRAGYMEETSLRIHGKETVSKIARRDAEPIYDREWEDEKRLRGEPKRRHRK